MRPAQGANWQVGDVFSAQGNSDGTGNAALIARFAPDGTLIKSDFAVMPGETKLKRGAVRFDYAGVAGYDLIVIAANDFIGPSTVYRIASTGIDAGAIGVVSVLATVPDDLEGVTTSPNDSTMYGPWAGKILAGAEYQGYLWTIDPVTGATQVFSSGDLRADTAIKVEDMWVVPANSAFYGLDFGEISGQPRMCTADASQWTNYVGRVLLAQEYYGELYTVVWNPNLNGPGAGGFTTELIGPGHPDGNGGPSHWEHITFAPTATPPACVIPDNEQTISGTS